MSSAGGDICYSCFGDIRPSAEFGTKKSPVEGQNGARTVTSDSDANGLEDGLGGGDTLRMAAVSSSNDLLWRNTDPKGYQEYLEHCKNIQKQTQPGIRNQMNPIHQVPNRSRSNCIIGLILIGGTAFVVLSTLMVLWHTKEITQLEISLTEMQKQLTISESQTAFSMKLLESNIRILVSEEVRQKLRNLENKDCEAISSCAWDICIGGFPRLLNKLWSKPSNEFQEIDSDINSEDEDASEIDPSHL